MKYTTSALNEHKKLHEGIKDLPIYTVCGKGFATEQICNKHMKNVNKNGSVKLLKSNI